MWRTANPNLSVEVKDKLVHDLMDARRAVKAAQNTAKIALGERGEVWWTDNAPDYNRHLVKNTPYASWFTQQNV